MKRFWTKQEDEILLKYAQTKTAQEIAEMLPD